MDVRIGLVYSPQPLEIEVADDTDLAALRAELSAALGDGGEGVVWITDKKGNQVGVVAERVTFVALGTGSDKGPIGFGS